METGPTERTSQNNILQEAKSQALGESHTGGPVFRISRFSGCNPRGQCLQEGGYMSALTTPPHPPLPCGAEGGCLILFLVCGH